MLLADKLVQLRKSKGLSQEEVADQLDVTRQTISKWEMGQSSPDLSKAKLLSQFYNVSYDFLVNESKTDQDFTNMEALSDAIDWSAAWSRKYPILATYSGIEGIDYYVKEIDILYTKMLNNFNASNQDTVLILKDILYKRYQQEKQK